MPEKALKDSIPDRDIIDMNTSEQKTKGQADGRGSNSPDETELQAYRFEFRGDDSLYAGSFQGRLTPEDIRGVLEALHGQAYQNCPETIRSYLHCHNLENYHFKAEVSPLDHGAVMSLAEDMLRSCSCGCIDSHTGGADNYFAVTDHQKQINNGCSEGCYLAMQRIMDNKACHYRIIGQTFTCNTHNGSTDAYFAIRSGGQNRKLHNLDGSAGEPVLPPFGCVDMAGTLMEIESLITAEQVKKTALK